MNNKLLAIAVAAGLSIPASAFAEVKIIGQAQLELVSASGDTKEGLTLDDGAENGKVGSGNASALGITGSHDLGNGMTGLYKVNMNFQGDDGRRSTGGETDSDVSTGGSSFFSARDVFIGLKGDFGTVLAGRINTPYKTATVKWDPLLSTFMQARGSNGMSGLNNGYADNVIAYANNFGDVKFVGAISLDEGDDNENAGLGDGELDGDHALTASVNFPVADSLELALAFINIDSLDDGMATKIGLKWAGDGMGASVQFETLDEDLGDANHIYGNYHMSVGNGGTVVVGIGTRTDESSGGDNDGTYTSLAFKKTLSKKVSAHVGFVSHDEGTIGADQDATMVGAGIRVKF